MSYRQPDIVNTMEQETNTCLGGEDHTTKVVDNERIYVYMYIWFSTSSFQNVDVKPFSVRDTTEYVVDHRRTRRCMTTCIGKFAGQNKSLKTLYYTWEPLKFTG